MAYFIIYKHISAYFTYYTECFRKFYYIIKALNNFNNWLSKAHPRIYQNDFKILFLNKSL